MIEDPSCCNFEYRKTGFHETFGIHVFNFQHNYIFTFKIPRLIRKSRDNPKPPTDSLIIGNGRRDFHWAGGVTMRVNWPP